MTGKIITVAQQKGGSGKTTLAAHLAVAGLGKKKTRVAILDVDPQGSLGEWFEAREMALGEEKTGLTFRTASGWGARREARSLARDFDYVIIDTPPKTDTDSRPAIEAADLVCIPIQPTHIDLWATDGTLSIAAKEDKIALLIMNRVPPRASLTAEIEAAMHEMNSRAAKARLGNRTAFAKSMGTGRTVLETMPSGKAAEEVAALTKEVFSQAGR